MTKQDDAVEPVSHPESSDNEMEIETLDLEKRVMMLEDKMKELEMFKVKLKDLGAFSRDWGPRSVIENYELADEQELADEIYKLLSDGQVRSKVVIMETLGCTKKQFDQARTLLIDSGLMQDIDEKKLVLGRICNMPNGFAIWTRKQVDASFESPMKLNKKKWNISELADEIYELLSDGKARPKTVIMETLKCTKRQFSKARNVLINEKRMQPLENKELVDGKICNLSGGYAVWIQELADTE